MYALCAARGVDFEDRAVVMGVADPRAPAIEDEVRSVASTPVACRPVLG